jgi:uncharacterized protein YjcR
MTARINGEKQCTGFMLRQKDYAEVYGVSVKTIKAWMAKLYWDLDDPPMIWKLVFLQQTQPPGFPMDQGRSWNNAWLRVASERGVIDD